MSEPSEYASYGRLIWRRFKRHKLGVVGGIVTMMIYVVALFVEFIAPYNPEDFSPRALFSPPQAIRLLESTPEGGRRLRLHALASKSTVDYTTGQRTYVPDPDHVVELGFFVKGDPYRMWGFVPWDRHLFGPVDPHERVYFLGTDRLGRDMLSRTIYATRISMTIGLIGVGLSLVLGLIIGGASGYFGGWIDVVIQRVIEFLQSLPSIPLWIGLAAAIPPTVPPVETYFLITVILSILGWTGLGRVVRGRFMALKAEDFVVAAQLDCCPPSRIIWRHMIPNFLSHIIAVVTLAIPGMIIAETSLSYLGIGLRQPVVSWGVLLQEAQNLRSISAAPWLFVPGVAVVVSVLALNFLGDGLRDAGDPYET
ncbi:ABC transporter permease [Consotaella aegiceratis]|uniref:ABC transporter permease n=1 Tax=Consotaella aegiceratis TaxID=3097961 RepID=UPI002F42601C